MEKFQERNLDTGNLFIFSEITEERVERTIEQLVYLGNKKRGRPKVITVWINSPGGLLQPALALADIFDNVAPTIRTIGLGSVESAASYVLMAGTKGHRYISKYSSIMLHEFSWANSGSYTEMAGRKKEIETTRRRQIEFVHARTGAPMTKIKRLLRHEESWLAPQEAIEFGLVDGIYKG